MNLHLEDKAVSLEKYGAAAENLIAMLHCTRFGRGKISHEKSPAFPRKARKRREGRVLVNISISSYTFRAALAEPENYNLKMGKSTRQGLQNPRHPKVPVPK